MSETLTQLAHELRTQGNAGTAHPLFIVQQRWRIHGMDSDYSDYFLWHSEDHEYQYDASEIQKEIRLDLANDQHVGDEDIDVIDRDPEEHGFEKVYYVDEWRFVTAHLTRKAAQRYIDENAHNLTTPRVYVSSQYRCPEWQEAVAHLAAS